MFTLSLKILFYKFFLIKVDIFYFFDPKLFSMGKKNVLKDILNAYKWKKKKKSLFSNVLPFISPEFK